MAYFPRPLTAVALANCLGNTSAEVFARARSGETRFSASDEVYPDLPFRVPVGAMKGLAKRSANFPWSGLETRFFQIVFASVLQIEAPVAKAVARWGKDRVSYVFSSSTGGLAHTEDSVEKGMRPDEFGDVLRDHSMHATNEDVMNYLGIAGYCYVVTTACSSSLKALKVGIRLIESGLADAVLVGCADTLCRTTLYGFRSLGILPDTPTSPFSAERAGLTLGEGSAYVLLERSAESPLAWVTGMGESSDAFHPSSPDPTGNGARVSMQEALTTAGLTPRDIDHVAAHATGTLQNDAMESLAIDALFHGTPVTATKSLTGHTLGAAGLTSLAFSLYSLEHQLCLPTLRSEPRDTGIPLSIVTRTTERALRHVMVNSFAFGGSNCSAILSRSHPPKREGGSS